MIEKKEKDWYDESNLSRRIVMSISVGSIMKLPVMKDASLVSQSGWNNVVDNITVAEASDIRFPNYGQGVFVLTTLSAYWQSQERVNALVEGFCKVNVAAIGIKLGRYVDKIDPSTVAIAEKYSVALIQLPSNVFFRNVLSEALSAIAGDQRILLHQINSFNDAMLASIVENRSAQDLMNLFCEKVKCYCCCVLPSQEKVAESSSLDRTADTEALGRITNDYFQKSGVPSTGCVEEGLYIYPCIVQGRLLAAVCIVTSDEEQELVHPLAQTLVNGICVKLLERDIKAQAARGVVASMLDEILFSEQTNADLAMERLKSLNFTTYRFFLICVLTSPFIYQDLNWPHIVGNIQGVFSQRFQSTLAFKRGAECVVFLSYESDAVSVRLRKILDECLENLEGIEQHKFYLGCSTVTENLAEVSERYREAKKALTYGCSMRSDTGTHLFEDYYELGLISYGTNSSEAQLFEERIIRPILEYDRQTKSDLWLTLEVSFREKTLDAAAKYLHIHISTLRYRLQKIEQITSYNFFDQNDRLKLYLAFILKKVSGNGGM